MSLHRELRWTILIQGSGAIASLATVVLLGLLAGPAAQGEFSLLKSALELLMAIAMLGVPQALLYFLRLSKVSQPQFMRMTLGTGLFGLACAAFYGLIQEKISLITLLLLAGATAAGTVHGVLRGAILASRPSGIFNAITALPHIFLLPAALMTADLSSRTDINVALPFFLTWLCSAAIAIFLSKNVAPPLVTDPVRLPQLLTFSGASWLTTVLISGTPALWLQYIEITSGLVATGHFAMGMVCVQVVLTPVNYAAPLLFKHWIGRANLSPIRTSLFYGMWVMVVMTACIALLPFLPLPPSTSEYSPLFRVAGYFAVIAVLESMMRVIYVTSIANGQPWLPVITEFTRILCLACLLLFSPMTTINGLAKIWIIGSICSIAMSYLATWMLPEKYHS